MGEIKEYEGNGLLFYYDGYGNRDAVIVSDEFVDQFYKMEKKPEFLSLDDKVIPTRNVLEIKKSKHCLPREIYYYGKTDVEKEVLKARIKKDDMKENVYTKFFDKKDDVAIERMEMWLLKGKNFTNRAN